MSSQSSVAVRSIQSLYPRPTSVRNNGISTPITCCDSIIKCPCKCLLMSTIIKNHKIENSVSEPADTAVNCSCSTSMSSSGFAHQPVCFNKSFHKHKFKCC